MEWIVECVETEPKKVKKKMKRVLPSWILEGKKQNLPDTEKIDSVKAGKINSRIEILFKNQEKKQLKIKEMENKYPLKITTRKGGKYSKKKQPKSKKKNYCLVNLCLVYIV